MLLDHVLENEIDRSTSRVQRERLSALIQGLKALGCNLLIPLFQGHEGDPREKMLGFVAMAGARAARAVGQ